MQRLSHFYTMAGLKTEGKHCCSVCNEILSSHRLRFLPRVILGQQTSCTAPRNLLRFAARRRRIPLGFTTVERLDVHDRKQPARSRKGPAPASFDGCDATDTVDIPANGHTEVTDAAVEPTCTMAGKTEGKHCSVCNEILFARPKFLQRDIPGQQQAALRAENRSKFVQRNEDGNPAPATIERLDS